MLYVAPYTGSSQHDLDLRFVPHVMLGTSTCIRVMLGTNVSLAYQVLCLGQV